MLSIIFSSFDARWAESIGFKFSPLNPFSSSSSTNSSTMDEVMKKESESKKQSEDSESKNKMKKRKNPRFAPELDGLHCFETILPY
ncbi:unnamed protein product [Amaranthus hypochondriacus]